MKPNRSGFYRRRDGAERLWFSPADIEAMMDDALRRKGAFPNESNPAVDIERFVRALGVRMDEHADLEPTVLGITEFYPDGPPKIFINRDLTDAIDNDTTAPGVRGRWRATIAHEASHVVMHRILFEVDQKQERLFAVEERDAPQRLMRCLKKNVLYRGGGGSDWREVQANMGMAALLMPQIVFRGSADRAAMRLGLTSEDLFIGSSASAYLAAEMATIFDVSKQAAGIRLETVGLLSAVGQKRLIPGV